MKRVTLCFCVQGDYILLAMKKRGFGAGKWNGYGGKVEDEDLRSAAVRELQEESGLTAAEECLKQVAILRFSFEGTQKLECHVFLADTWEGIPQETEEMKPQWFRVSQFPFDAMWAADREWIPLILAGETLEADIEFDTSGTEVRSFSYYPRQFT